MDISLHSFILVIGLIVIAFIIWDGIKKVRAARANRLDQSLNGFESPDLLDNEELPKFDDLEIKEELLHDSLNQIDAAKSVESSSPDFTFEVQPETPKDEDVKPAESNYSNEIDDGFEHFSAKDDDPFEDEIAVAVSNVKTQSNLAEKVSAETVKAKESIVETSKEKPVVKPQRKSKEELAAQLAEAKAQAAIQEEKPASSPIEDVKVDEKESVPVLMEPVELGQKVEPNPPKQHELVLPERIQQTLIDEPVIAEKEEPSVIVKKEKVDPLMEYIEDVQAMPVGEKLSEREAAQEIFVINILKQDGKGLLGKELNHVFQVCDMRFGEMDIFHRFEKANAQGKIQFSVVNAIEPGTFDMTNIDELVTPGISLFMSLPGPDKPMEAFDAMAEVALVFSRNFNATLHDDTHSDLTPQTLEHYRNRIREFTRKHLSHKK